MPCHIYTLYTYTPLYIILRCYYPVSCLFTLLISSFFPTINSLQMHIYNLSRLIYVLPYVNHKAPISHPVKRIPQNEHWVIESLKTRYSDFAVYIHSGII